MQEHVEEIEIVRIQRRMAKVALIAYRLITSGLLMKVACISYFGGSLPLTV